MTDCLPRLVHKFLNKCGYLTILERDANGRKTLPGIQMPVRIVSLDIQYGKARAMVVVPYGHGAKWVNLDNINIVEKWDEKNLKPPKTLACLSHPRRGGKKRRRKIKEAYQKWYA